jgi:hypothetical protein
MKRGSAIARIAGQNAKKHSDLFEEEVKIWVFEEEARTLHLNIVGIEADI